MSIFQAYQVVQRILEGHNPGLQVWTSDEVGSPYYKVIVISADQSRCKNPFYRQLVHLFSNDATEIVNILTCPGVVDFGDNVFFYGISEEEMAYISRLDVLQKYEVTYTDAGYRFWCHDTESRPSLSIPDGYTVSRITTDILQKVENVSWGKGMEGFGDALRDIMDWEFANVCVYNEDGEPVGWAQKSFWGEQGTLFVKEPHRRKGIGKYIVAQLANEIVSMEGMVYALVEEGNVASGKLHEAAGFIKDGSLKAVSRRYSLV